MKASTWRRYSWSTLDRGHLRQHAKLYAWSVPISYGEVMRRFDGPDRAALMLALGFPTGKAIRQATKDGVLVHRRIEYPDSGGKRAWAVVHEGEWYVFEDRYQRG